MKFIVSQHFWTALLVMSLFSSCVKELDFDQVEDVVLTPVLDLDFVYGDFDTNQLIGNIDIPDIPDIPVDLGDATVVQDTLNYDVFESDEFNSENLERVVLDFEFQNSFPRSIDFQFQFWNESNEPLGNFYVFNIPSGNGEGTPSVISKSPEDFDSIIFETADIDNILARARKVYVEATVRDLNTALRGRLTLRSKGTYYIRYEL